MDTVVIPKSVLGSLLGCTVLALAVQVSCVRDDGDVAEACTEIPSEAECPPGTTPVTVANATGQGFQVQAAGGNNVFGGDAQIALQVDAPQSSCYYACVPIEDCPDTSDFCFAESCYVCCMFGVELCPNGTGTGGGEVTNCTCNAPPSTAPTDDGASGTDTTAGTSTSGADSTAGPDSTGTG